MKLITVRPTRTSNFQVKVVNAWFLNQSKSKKITDLKLIKTMILSADFRRHR